MRISEHVSYSEATRSQEAVRYGIDNIPTPEDILRMNKVAERCFEPLRRHHGKPIFISSFYRSPELNKKISGSETSDHCKGRAIDIDADYFDNGMTNAEMFYWLKENVEFDQLIWEYGDDKNPAWVHISYRSKFENRKQVLRASKNGYTYY